MYSSNSMLNLLLQVHIQQTNLPNPPFSFECEFDYNKFDKEKYTLITKSNEELDNFVDLCFNEFNQTYPNLPIGSVHINPITWIKFALKVIALGYKNKETNKILFPNGCCSQGPKCPINMFYLIVLKNIMIQNN